MGNGNLLRLISSPSWRKGFWHALTSALIVLVVGVSLTTYVGNLVREANIDRHRAAAVSVLSEARARLLGTIGRTLSLGTGLMNYVVVNPRLGELQFRRYSTEMMAQDRSIRSIALAPGNVIQFIHPVEGNQRAIGLDYTQVRDQWPGIRRAMDTHSIVLVGPVNLVQGGRAVIARLPIFVPAFAGAGTTARTYWGMGSVVFDEKAMLASAGMSALIGGYHVALQVPGSDEQETQGVLGDQELFATDSAQLDVMLPGATTWRLAAMPDGGWVSTSTELWLALSAGYGATLLVACMSFFVVYEMLRARLLAHHDALTGLPNRRLLEDRMEQLANLSDRTGIGFQVFFVDLNAFKPVNDQHGHHIGDMMLVEIGRRLREETRRADTVARMGGDEFVVLTPGIMNEAAALQFGRRLETAVSEPMVFANVTMSVKASVGLASYPVDARTIRELLNLADTRMYAQKQKRRNAALSGIGAANVS